MLNTYSDPTDPTPTPAATPEKPCQPGQLPRKPWKCPSCKTPLGETDGMRLYCGETAAFMFKVTVLCTKCGCHRQWRPVVMPYDRR